jgi:hypothetical protein
MNGLSDGSAVELDLDGVGGDTLGGTLRQLRLRARLTQEPLAERAGLSVRTINGLENGRIEQRRGSSVRCLAEAPRPEDGERRTFTTLAKHASLTSRLMNPRPGASAQGLVGSRWHMVCRRCLAER